jgi:hypothetical protein
MVDRDIRAWLRGATRARILVGWYTYGFGAMRKYVINPAYLETSTYTASEVSSYCAMLREAGIEPVYRDSESQVV